MGFLHQGHLSLVRASKQKSDFTVVSIFINPTQFAAGEDFEKYPRDFEKDKNLLEIENADLLFYPDIKEIYGFDFQTFVAVERISKFLEGKYRPEHFKGVTTIVNILFNCVKPDYAFFGQKDAQQVEVIKQMVSDLKMGIKIVVCPIVREENGLAMSSRNVYLSAEEKEVASTIHNALLYGRKFVEEDREIYPQNVIDNMKSVLHQEKSIKVDYIAIVNAYGFREVELIDTGNEYYILIAARVGNTRLIDNEFIRLR
jgi:pantoate--beta-alanine ligase